MKSVGDNLPVGRTSGPWCLVGYGNPERQDDGLGPEVINRATRVFRGRPEVRCLVRRQLDPDLLDDLAEAETVVLVDATVDQVETGRQWARVKPSLQPSSPLSHEVEPSFLLGLLWVMYRKMPSAWVVAIQGDHFGYGQGLSDQANIRASLVLADLIRIINQPLPAAGNISLKEDFHYGHRT